MTEWTLADMPRQDGRLAIVTGGNSGIGYETALALAKAGARVIVAARSVDKGRAAAATIGHDAEWRRLDLADLASVARFAEEMAPAGAIDLLILNAGIMAPPRRQTSAQGFELQFATNYLGHFALAARLWPQLESRPGARIVSLSSIAARRDRIRFDDLQSERPYDAFGAYAQTKLATLIFARELARRLERAGSAVLSVAAHPGVARTALFGSTFGQRNYRRAIAEVLVALAGQSAAAGARPVLRAATDPMVQQGDYIGSIGWMEMKGPPGPARLPAAARDEETAARLWAISEELTGVSFQP